MKRLLLALILTPLILTGVALSSAAGLPAQLRAGAVLTGDTVQLGDLWDNLGDKAGIAIAASPQPGRRITLNARWLQAVAANNGVDWHPVNAFDHIVVERAGQSVDPSIFETALRKELVEQGMPASSDIQINGRADLAVTIPVDEAPIAAVHDLFYDTRTQQFSATLEVPAGSPSALRLRVSGRSFAMSRLPVLTHAMNRGEVVGPHDVQWISMREDALQRDVATDVSQVIGMEPRYLVKAGAAIRLGDLRRPVLVTRNTLVTMVLRSRFMTLTAQGKAEGEGGRGDVIKVTNLQTKQVVEATIEAPGTVVIGMPTAPILSN